MGIYMMRHGKTEANEKKYYATAEEPLLPVDGAIIRTLQKQVRELKVKAIVTSPFLRAKETARLVNECGVVLKEEPLIREVSLGVLEGHTFCDAYGRYGDLLQPWIDDPYTYGPPGGESLTEAGRRARQFLRRVEDDTLYVSHDGFMRLVLAEQRGDLHAFFDYKLENFQIIALNLQKK